MATFRETLQGYTREIRAKYREGSSLVEADVAGHISGLHMSLRSMWEGLPWSERDTFRHKFRNDVLRFDSVTKILADDIAGGDRKLRGTLNRERELFRALEKGQIVQGDAQGQNVLYRFTVEGRKKLETLIRQNASTLGIADDEVGAYMHYISGLNMNLRPGGDIRISPGGHLTAEASELMYPTYSAARMGEADSIWNQTERRRAIVFDIETGGGPASAANVNEVAARAINVGGGRSMRFGTPIEERFSVNRMTLGTFADGTDARPLNLKFRQGSEDLFTAVAGDGAEFATRVKPILQQMAAADSILGQNIIGFDIEHLIGNVMRTSTFLQGKDRELVGYIDTIKTKMQQPGYVVDTLEMLREYEAMQGKTLGTSKLMPKGERTTRSIQNVLLNTNLIDYMRAEQVGGQSLWDVATASGGHHTASFDTTVTAALYQAMVDQKLELNRLPRIYGPEGVGLKAIKDIVSSTAYTPASKIADPADVLDKTWATMYQRGIETRGRAFRLEPVDRRKKGLKPIIPKGRPGELEEMIDIATSDDRYRLQMNATYLEQTSIHTRDLSGTTSLIDDTDELYPIAGRAGDAWEVMTRMRDPYAGTLNQDGSIFKAGTGWSIDEFTEYQKSIAGLPYSTIGMPERNLTMAAVYGSRIGTARENLALVHGGALSALDVVPELGSSYWRVDPTLLREGAAPIIRTSTGGTGTTTFGMTLDTARNLNAIAKANLFDLDIAEDAMPMFEVNMGRFSGGPFANLQMNMIAGPNLSPEGRRAVINEIKDMNLSSDVETALIGRIRGTIDDPLKITVASMTDESAGMLLEVYEQGAYNLFGGTPLRAQLVEELAAEVGPGERRGALRIGALLLGDTYTDPERAVLDQNAEVSLKVGQALREGTGKTEFLQAERDAWNARRVREGATGPAVPPNFGVLEYERAKARIRGAVNSGYDRVADLIESTGVTGGRAVKPSFLKKATIPALALGLFAAFARRNEEEELYDQTFEQGPTTANGYYSAGVSSADPIHKRVRPRVNPLATANLVFENYDNRIGHTRPPGRM